MNIRSLIKKTTKIRIAVLLIILGVCIVVLMDKRRTESALVSQGSDIAASIWPLLAFLPPGDFEPANSPRTQEVTLKSGLSLKAEFEFGEEMNPWPSLISLTYQADKPGDKKHRLVTINPPFVKGEPKVEFMNKSGAKEADAKLKGEINRDLQEMNSILSAKRPGLSPFDWQEMEGGFQTATAYMRYGPRLGGRELHMARFNPAGFDFQPWHEKELGIDSPKETLGIEGWAARLPLAASIINGGQYEVDRSYIGWLRRDGHYISEQRKRSWSAFFVSNPQAEAGSGAPKATIIDAEESGRSLRPETYENIMQSLMLLDAKGKIRVNNSFHLASRAAVAEDKEGWIWFIMAPGAISLHDLATVLSDLALKLARVLCLDGGFEAQIMWRESDGEDFMDIARYLVFPGETIYSPFMGRTLPSVITAIPVNFD